MHSALVFLAVLITGLRDRVIIVRTWLAALRFGVWCSELGNLQMVLKASSKEEHHKAASLYDAKAFG